MYAAAEDPTRWPEALATAQNLAGAVAAGVFVQDLKERTGWLRVHLGGDARYVESYHRYYARINPWFATSEVTSRPGTVSLVGESRPLIGTEYYQDFWRPQGFGPTLSAYLRNDGRFVEGLILTREKGTNFTAAEVALLERLAPWLVQASRIEQALSAATAEREALSAAIEHVVHGVVLLDRQAEISFANSVARELLAEGDAIALKRGAIMAAGPCKGPSLTKLIDAALRTSLPGARPTGGLTSIERASGHPITVRVVPLPNGYRAAATQRAAVALFVVDQEKHHLLDQDELRKVYDLSPAEARLAVRIANGLTLDQIAQEIHGPGKETLRTQLRAVFRKTQTRRQAELMHVLLSRIGSARPPKPRQI